MYLVTKGFQNKLRAKHITKRSSDSCRTAFLVCSGLRGESGLRKVG
ncbi:MAG: DUF3265 domain-containing protein [Gammaproteobacteria bacterium]